jgi:Domain of unknown function DUF29
MPDGPRYDDDFYAWTQYQAAVLRSLATSDNRFDRDHVAEEIEDLGRSERNAVRSEVRRILGHFLKLAHSPAADPTADWMVSIANARAELEERLSATLRHYVEANLGRIFRQAGKTAEIALRKHQETLATTALPAECPYTLDQILAEEWYPAPPALGR